MTYYDVLCALMGDVPLDNDGTPCFCPRHAFETDDENCAILTCWNCWHREWKGEKYIK